MDRENNHIANKNKQSKYGKLYFNEHSSEYLSTVWYPDEFVEDIVHVWKELLCDPLSALGNRRVR